MPLIFGGDKVKSIYVGGQRIKKAYFGEELVYSEGGGNNIVLPDGYTQLAYIDSSSADVTYMAALKLGISVKPTFRLVISAQILNLGRKSNFIAQLRGVGTNANYYYYYIYVNNGDLVAYELNYNTSRKAVLMENYDFQKVVIDWDHSTGIVTCNGEIKGTDMNYVTNTSVSKDVYIPANVYSDLPNPLRLFAVQYYDGDTIVADCIPCKNAAGAVGVYDIIRDKFVTATTSSNKWIAGPEV